MIRHQGTSPKRRRKEPATSDLATTSQSSLAEPSTSENRPIQPEEADYSEDHTPSELLVEPARPIETLEITDIEGGELTNNNSVGVQACINTPALSRARTQLRKLRRRNLYLKHVWLNERAKSLRLIAALRKCKERSTQCMKCDAISQLPTHAKNFVNEQVKSSQGAQRIRWSNTTIAIAQCLLYKSPSSFRKLKQYFAFPSATTLYRRAPDTAKEVS